MNRLKLAAAVAVMLVCVAIVVSAILSLGESLAQFGQVMLWLLGAFLFSAAFAWSLVVILAMSKGGDAGE